MKAPSRAAAGLDASALEALVRLGTRIRDARTGLGWTRDTLADRILCSRATLQRIESGDPRVAIGLVIAAGEAVGAAVLADADAEPGAPARRPRAKRRRSSDAWFE